MKDTYLRIFQPSDAFLILCVFNFRLKKFNFMCEDLNFACRKEKEEIQSGVFQAEIPEKFFGFSRRGNGMIKLSLNILFNSLNLFYQIVLVTKDIC